MPRFLPLLLLILFAGCGPSAPLAPGRWTGALSPMHHPEMETPLSYNVSYEYDDLVLTLRGPGGSMLPTRDARLDGDTLRFAFDEPEMGIPLTCALGPASFPRTRSGGKGFAGRCTDRDGKWAWFTMRPPEWYLPGERPPGPR